MSVLAGCGHKAEWICPSCARCALCCECIPEFEPVHINTKEAAVALGKFARESRQKKSGGPGDPTARSAFSGGEPPQDDRY